MALLLNAQGLAKAYGSTALFRDLSLTVSEGDRIGLIGPNGSGKSTLLEILAGRKDADSGEVAVRKRTRLVYVAQDSQFAAGETVRQITERAAAQAAEGRDFPEATVAEALGRAGFEDQEAEAAALSGGWRKRLALVEALVQEPDILLLDEPTNHLDLAGIEWLENTLQSMAAACVVVSHDRYFLENVATAMVELNRMYAEGLLRVPGNYSTFLEKKGEYLHAQTKRQESLENRVRTEMEWLRRGPKARTTKSKARIDKANELIGELSDLSSRTRTATAGIDFSATGRKTKRLLELEGVSGGYDGRCLFSHLDFVMTAGMRVGLVGPNGSGKSTLLRIFTGQTPPLAGEIRRAEALRVVYFDQNRQLDPDVTLRRALAPEGDSVIYQDRVIHVASWAARFLFPNESLNQPVGRLSGGERARVLIAKLMLEPADLLLLDEPTNDLDIPTLEILEENLLEFRGALVLVTHDRYLLDRVSTVVLGLDGQGGVERFADYSQWDAWQSERKSGKPKGEAAPEPVAPRPAAARARKKLSYLENREYESIEERIAVADQDLAARRAETEDPAVVSDPSAVQEAYRKMEEAQQRLDDLYARWAELEAKLG